MSPGKITRARVKRAHGIVALDSRSASQAGVVLPGRCRRRPDNVCRCSRPLNCRTRMILLLLPPCRCLSLHLPSRLPEWKLRSYFRPVYLSLLPPCRAAAVWLQSSNFPLSLPPRRLLLLSLTSMLACKLSLSPPERCLSLHRPSWLPAHKLLLSSLPRASLVVPPGLPTAVVVKSNSHSWRIPRLFLFCIYI